MPKEVHRCRERNTPIGDTCTMTAIAEQGWITAPLVMGVQLSLSAGAKPLVIGIEDKGWVPIGSPTAEYPGSFAAPMADNSDYWLGHGQATRHEINKISLRAQLRPLKPMIVVALPRVGLSHRLGQAALAREISATRAAFQASNSHLESLQRDGLAP
jgi:hypothetical protein